MGDGGERRENDYIRIVVMLDSVVIRRRRMQYTINSGKEEKDECARGMNHCST